MDIWKNKIILKKTIKAKVNMNKEIANNQRHIWPGIWCNVK